MHAFVRAITCLAPFLCCGGFPSARAQTEADCAALAKLELPGVAIEITQTEWLASYTPPASPIEPALREPLPPHCRVDGMLERRTGHEGKPYGIGFALALPENWNGRFLFQGGGGLNGSVRPPLGTAAAGDEPALARGFAVVSTDSGHQSTAVFDAGFFADQEAALNFLYLAIGKVTVVARQILHEYYGRGPAGSYYVGCSTGGREAMLMSQRYPSYFDGIVAGAPAMRTSYSNLGDRFVAVTLNRIAPKDAAGKPIPGGAFSDSDKKLVISKIADACDARDGLADGMIFDTLGCDFDPETLVCAGAKTDACLTAAQAQAIKTAFAGPRDARGHQVYPGFLYDTGITASGMIPGLLNAGPSPLGPPNFATEQNVDQESVAVANPIAAVGDSTWTNLSTFSGHGGKLIFYHGVSDPWFSALDTLDYYRRMSEDNGGAEAVSEWSRLFLVPGMGHCGGGAALDRFDLLSAVVDWVEKGRAPDHVIATGNAFKGRSRPLCPHPKHAHYKGEGDPEQAENFDCRE